MDQRKQTWMGKQIIREGMHRLQERAAKDLLRHDAPSWMDLVRQLDARTRDSPFRQPNGSHGAVHP